MNALRYFAMVVAVLITQLCTVSPSKATVQRLFCAGWPDMPNTLRAEGYQSLFSGLTFYVDKDNIKSASEMVDLAGAGSTKVTHLERLNILLSVVLHPNRIDETDDGKKDLLDHASRLIRLEGTYRFPLKYLLFYYSDDRRLAIVMRDVKFDEKDHISPGERGCVMGIFSHVELYDVRKGSGDKDNNAHAPANHQKSRQYLETKLSVLRCGAYYDIIGEETSVNNHVFVRMIDDDVANTWQKLILMRGNMENGSIWTEDEHGTLIKEWSFNTVLITDYMKSILEKLP